MTEALDRIKAAVKPILGEYVSPAKLDAAALAAVDAMQPEFRRCYDLGHADAEREHDAVRRLDAELDI